MVVERGPITFYLFLVAFPFIFGSLAYGQKNELILAPEIVRELNFTLEVGNDLHDALLKQDDERVDVSLHDLIKRIDQTKRALGSIKPHERSHLAKILEAAQEHFEITRRASGDERRSHMAEGYNQLVNLVRIFPVDRSYYIFFCPKDRTTWFQRGSRGANPFVSFSHDSCGIRVPR